MAKLVASKQEIERIRETLPNELKHELDNAKPLTEEALKELWDSKEPVYGSLKDTFWNEPDTVQAAVNLSHHMKIAIDNLLNGGIMSTKSAINPNEVFDFSDEYLTETIDLGIFNGYPFFVTVQEIPHGKYTQLQKSFIGKMHIPENKREAARIMAEKEVDPVQYSDNRNLAGIQSWTLKRKDGTDIGVIETAWNALPHRLTEQIEAAIERVNPKIADDFPSETGSEDTQQQEV